MGEHKFKRKNIRLPHVRYLGQQWYFLTACTEGRLPRFQNPALISENLGLLTEKARSAGFAIQAYCFMPDHLHTLVSGIDSQSNLLPFANGFKQVSAYTFKQRTGERLWQHKFYDHVLRPTERWEAVAWYIWMNPVRKGLCARPEAWPFSGSQTVDWRRLLTPPEELWIPPWKT